MSGIGAIARGALAGALANRETARKQQLENLQLLATLGATPGFGVGGDEEASALPPVATTAPSAPQSPMAAARSAIEAAGVPAGVAEPGPTADEPPVPFSVPTAPPAAPTPAPSAPRRALDVARLTMGGHPIAITYDPTQAPAARAEATRQSHELLNRAAHGRLTTTDPDSYPADYDPAFDYSAAEREDRQSQQIEQALIKTGMSAQQAKLLARYHIDAEKRAAELEKLRGSTDHFTFPVAADDAGKPAVYRANTRTGEITPTGVAGRPSNATSTGAARVRTLIASNEQQIGLIDDALREVAAYPNAVGFERGVETVDQRIDPQGVAARAAVANIGSLVMHDRSGAAVTISEAPRLRPFIPSVRDTPATIAVKLGKLKKMLQDLNANLAVPLGDQGGGDIDLGASGYSPDNPFAGGGAGDDLLSRFGITPTAPARPTTPNNFRGK